MIEILSNKTKYTFRYEGNIELSLEEPFIIIKADRIIQEEDELGTCGTLTFDSFWVEDIISIKGKNNA